MEYQKNSMREFNYSILRHRIDSDEVVMIPMRGSNYDEDSYEVEGGFISVLREILKEFIESVQNLHLEWYALRQERRDAGEPGHIVYEFSTLSNDTNEFDLDSFIFQGTDSGCLMFSERDEVFHETRYDSMPVALITNHDEFVRVYRERTWAIKEENRNKSDKKKAEQESAQYKEYLRLHAIYKDKK